MIRAAAFAMAGLICLCACADTTAIKDFANESRVISSDATVINGSDVAFAAAKQYTAEYPDVVAWGPGTPEFDESKKVAILAAAVLQKYMLVLARLAGDATVAGGTGEAGAAASLKTLGITSATVSSGLDNPLWWGRPGGRPGEHDRRRDQGEFRRRDITAGGPRRR